MDRTAQEAQVPLKPETTASDQPKDQAIEKAHEAVQHSLDRRDNGGPPERR